jgi:hypothetical protein
VENGMELYLCVVCCFKIHESYSIDRFFIHGTALNMPILHIEAGGIDAKLLNDQNNQTCDWFRDGDEMKLKLESTSRIASVTLIMPYEGRNIFP